MHCTLAPDCCLTPPTLAPDYCLTPQYARNSGKKGKRGKKKQKKNQSLTVLSRRFVQLFLVLNVCYIPSLICPEDLDIFWCPEITTVTRCHLQRKVISLDEVARRLLGEEALQGSPKAQCECVSGVPSPWLAVECQSLILSLGYRSHKDTEIVRYRQCLCCPSHHREDSSQRGTPQASIPLSVRPK